MRGGMKMLMISGRGGSNGRNETEMRRGGARGDIDMRYGGEMNYREPGYEMDEPESRRYRRYSDGRFAPRSEYGGGEMAYPASPFVPPIYERGERSMNPIGFVPGGYSTYATHKQGDEMEHRTSKMERGGAYGKTTKLTREMADEWTEGLQNEDGSTGPHWTMEQVKQVMAQRNIKAEPIEFYAVMNALYADYCKVFQKHNVNKIDMYADLTSAWLEDKDAEEGKAALYYECIVKK